jgi:hypothetical protein
MARHRSALDWCVRQYFAHLAPYKNFYFLAWKSKFSSLFLDAAWRSGAHRAILRRSLARTGTTAKQTTQSQGERNAAYVQELYGYRITRARIAMDVSTASRQCGDQPHTPLHARMSCTALPRPAVCAVSRGSCCFCCETRPRAPGGERVHMHANEPLRVPLNLVHTFPSSESRVICSFNDDYALK